MAYYPLKLNDSFAICAINIICHLNNEREGTAPATTLQQPFLKHWKLQYEQTTGKDFGRSISYVLQKIRKYHPLLMPLIYNEKIKAWYVNEIYSTYDQFFIETIEQNIVTDGQVFRILGYELNDQVIVRLDYAFEHVLGENKSIKDFARYEYKLEESGPVTIIS